MQISVPYVATVLGGTSAFLKYNDTLSLQELLYGLMLPSGNDAAMTIAIHCGHLLNQLKKNRMLSFPPCDTI